MKKLAILMAMGGLAVGAHATNLISDGGFEMGDVFTGQFDGSVWSTQYGYATNNSPSGPNSIWDEGFMRVMDQDLAANNAGTGHSSWDPVIRDEGHSYLAVNGATRTNPSPFVLTQDFANTGFGSTLSISMASVNLYAPGGAGATTQLEVFLDGVSLGTASTFVDNLWRTSSFTGTVLSNTGFSQLKIVANTSQASGNDFGLDNVQVNAVPEPFTMSLGLASAGLFVRRRLKAKRA